MVTDEERARILEVIGFEFAVGSVMGRDHQLTGKNNQDGWWLDYRGNNPMISGVVCDGCSETPQSHVGATLTARILSRLALQVPVLPFDQNFLPLLEQKATFELYSLISRLDAYCQSAAYQYFMFTVVGFVVTPDWFMMYSVGDGVWGVNDEVGELGSFPGNQPPYFVYGNLIASSISPDLCKLQQTCLRPTEKIHNFLVGTDGVAYIMKAEDKNLPGRDEKVGPVSQVWANDAFYKNSDALRRRLALINRDVQKVDWAAKRVKKSNGLLPDDTTIMCARKTDKGNANEECAT
jgi:hypothetical protein